MKLNTLIAFTLLLSSITLNLLPSENNQNNKRLASIALGNESHNKKKQRPNSFPHNSDTTIDSQQPLEAFPTDQLFSDETENTERQINLMVQEIESHIEKHEDNRIQTAIDQNMPRPEFTSLLKTVKPDINAVTNLIIYLNNSASTDCCFYATALLATISDAEQRTTLANLFEDEERTTTIKKMFGCLEFMRICAKILNSSESKKFNREKFRYCFSTELHDLTLLSEKEGIDINDHIGATLLDNDTYGNNPLHSAIAQQHHPLIEFLLDLGAHPECFDIFETILPLERAITLSDLQSTLLLLRAGANPNTARSGKHSFVELAAMAQEKNILPWLIQFGAQIPVFENTFVSCINSFNSKSSKEQLQTLYTIIGRNQYTEFLPAYLPVLANDPKNIFTNYCMLFAHALYLSNRKGYDADEVLKRLHEGTPQHLRNAIQQALLAKFPKKESLINKKFNGDKQ